MSFTACFTCIKLRESEYPSLDRIQELDYSVAVFLGKLPELYNLSHLPEGGSGFRLAKILM